jgi:hypothetical protein
MEKGAAVYAVESGRYIFQSSGLPEIPKPPKVKILKAPYGELSDPLGVLRKPVSDKLVVLTFDDGCSTHATYVAPLLKSLGFGASFYVCTLPSFPNKNWYMSWEQMKAMAKDGFEIGNHTREHAVGSGIGPFLDMENEMMKNGLAKPVTQAWPCYVPNTNTFADLSSNKYVFARGGHFRPYRPAVDHPLDIPSVSPKDMKTFIRDVQQAANGCVVVITYHGVPDYEHDFAGTEPGLFKQMMQYLKDNHYKVIALRDLAAYVDPQKAAKLPPTR